MCEANNEKNPGRKTNEKDERKSEEKRND